MSIKIADNFEYLGRKPFDSRLVFSNIAEMKNIAEASVYDGCFAYVTSEKKYYTYDSSNDIDSTLGKWREFEAGGATIQYEELPEPSEEWEGKIIQYTGPDDEENNLFYGYFYACGYYTESGSPTKYYVWDTTPVQRTPHVIQIDSFPMAESEYVGLLYQYIGSTTANYTHGYFYECIEDSENPGSYIWKQTDTQPSGGGGGGTSSTDITATLVASGWDANNQQTLTFTGYDSTKNGVIGVPISASATIKDAYAEAEINVVSISTNQFTFEAKNVPTIDLPVVLIVY